MLMPADKLAARAHARGNRTNRRRIPARSMIRRVDCSRASRCSPLDERMPSPVEFDLGVREEGIHRSMIVSRVHVSGIRSERIRVGRDRMSHIQMPLPLPARGLRGDVSEGSPPGAFRALYILHMAARRRQRRARGRSRS